MHTETTTPSSTIRTSIALPNSLHLDWTLRALDAGKHVLCEKPLTRRATEAEQAPASSK